MTTEDALLAAIWEHPHEDTPRLVFADWLQENGQPERAEFIRLQIELAKLDEWDEATRPALAKREQALWRKHAKGWKAGLPKPLHLAAFARGFPAPRSRTVATTKFLKLPASEFAAAPLWTIVLPPAPASLGKLLACPHLLRVGALGFMGWLDANTAKTFVASPNVRNLAALDLQWSSNLGTDGLAALAGGAAAMPHLRRLNLSVCWLNDRGIARLADSPLSNQLTHLDVSGNSQLTVGAIKSVFSRGKFPALTDFSTSSSLGTVGLRAVADSSPAFRLRRLSIYVEERGALKAFSAWSGLRSVRVLDLKNSLIRDRVGALFASPQLADLRVLRLEMMGNRAPDLKAFEALAAGSLLPGLRELHLGYGRQVLGPVAGKLRDRFGDGLTIT